MKKLIALFSAVFFVFALTGANVWAADPEPETPVIDRHAVWTNDIENHKSKGSGSSDDQSAKSGDEVQEKQSLMGIKTEDLPWQRVG